ncbi:hypothetical protein Pelo_19474 [Pelomyxa schiedti]|nr:hypothetical protein Pelo_19474 [Pelomyxa schiedti]
MITTTSGISGASGVLLGHTLWLTSRWWSATLASRADAATGPPSRGFALRWDPARGIRGPHFPPNTSSSSTLGCVQSQQLILQRALSGAPHTTRCHNRKHKEIKQSENPYPPISC